MDIQRLNTGFGSRVTVFDGQAVSGERTLTSDPIPVKGQGAYGVWFQASSATGAPKLQLTYEMSYDDDEDNFVKPRGGGDIVASWSGEWSGETPVVVDIDPPNMSWIRFKAKGLVANPNDTIITEVLINV